MTKDSSNTKDFHLEKLSRLWPLMAIAPAFIVLADYLAVSKYGTDALLFFQAFIFLGIPVAVLAIPVFIVALFLVQHKKRIIIWIIVCTIFTPATIAAIKVGAELRRNAFQELTIRSRPLIYAIEDYTSKSGNPPNSLDQLIPTYFTEVPKTGMMAYPEYRYLSGEDAEEYEGNPWIIYISTPGAGIDFDRFYYFPLQNYPEQGYGGGFERIKEWAYLHE